MGNKLRYKDYESDGPFDVSYMKAVFDEFHSDINLQVHEMMDLFFLFKNMVFATDTESVKATCTYRKCYDDTKYTCDKIWVVDHGNGETPSLLCKACMKDFGYENRGHKTLYEVLSEQKREVAAMGVRGLRARALPHALERVYMEEYVEVDDGSGIPGKKKINWYSYPHEDSASNAITNYYRGRGFSVTDSCIIAEGLIERWKDDVRHYERILHEVKLNLEQTILSEDGVWCGVVVTPKTDKPCEYGNRVPDIYWWVDYEDKDLVVEVTSSYPIMHRRAYEND